MQNLESILEIIKKEQLVIEKNNYYTLLGNDTHVCEIDQELIKKPTKENFYKLVGEYYCKVNVPEFENRITILLLDKTYVSIIKPDQVVLNKFFDIYIGRTKESIFGMGLDLDKFPSLNTNYEIQL